MNAGISVSLFSLDRNFLCGEYFKGRKMLPRLANVSRSIVSFESNHTLSSVASPAEETHTGPTVIE